MSEDARRRIGGLIIVIAGVELAWIAAHVIFRIFDVYVGNLRAYHVALCAACLIVGFLLLWDGRFLQRMLIWSIGLTGLLLDAPRGRMPFGRLPPPERACAGIGVALIVLSLVLMWLRRARKAHERDRV